jgi:hypothetical protein
MTRATQASPQRRPSPLNQKFLVSRPPRSLSLSELRSNRDCLSECRQSSMLSETSPSLGWLMPSWVRRMMGAK